MSYSLIYITASDIKEAKKIGKHLMENLFTGGKEKSQKIQNQQSLLKLKKN